MNNTETVGCVLVGRNHCVPFDEFHKYALELVAPGWDEILYIVCYVIVFFCGLVGNSLVCIVIIRDPHMHTVTNVFIFNLAVADLLVIVLVLVPTMIADLFRSWLFGDLGCPIIHYLQRVSIIVSVLTLTAISVERFYAICEPLKFRSNITRASITVIVIWIIALLSSISDLLYNRTYHPVPEGNTTILLQCGGNQGMAYFIFYSFAFFVFPFIAMAVAYFRIARCLWVSQVDQLSGSTNGNVPGQAANSQLIQRRKTAKMLIAVVVCFFACYFLHVYIILSLLFWSIPADFKVHGTRVGHLLMYVNSAINPVIYNFLSEKFRRAFWAVCSCCRRCSTLRPEQTQLRPLKSDQHYRDETKVTEM